MSTLRRGRESFRQRGPTLKRRPEALVNRRNYHDTRAFLRYREEVRQNDPRTVEFSRVSLDHLLKWATSTPFSQIGALRPTLPAYLESLNVSVSYRAKLLQNIRDFLTYARDTWPERYPLNRGFLDSLHTRQLAGTVAEPEVWSLEDVRTLTAFAPENIRDEADIAAVAFLFLSGMRVSAFTSLPVKAVDFSREPVLVRQWPDLGVRTKNRKAANTFLLPQSDLDDLRAIARAWDAKVREALGDGGLWYAVLDPDGGFATVQEAGIHRDDALRRRLRSLCERAGVTYRSPHKLRHGHIAWARDRCVTVAEFKAVSQNVMHESMNLTDARYATLSDSDLAARLSGLGEDQRAQVAAVIEQLFGGHF